MPYRDGNYSAFYVAEPFQQGNLGAHAAPDFKYYHMLQAWSSVDLFFPFYDSHEKNYNVRDTSDWDSTLKPRLRERLRNSKNIILFLSSNTKASRALTEEIEYGVGVLGLPVIVVYPEFDPISSNGSFDSRVYSLWNKLPAFWRLMDNVPTLHIPFQKEDIKAALGDSRYSVHSKREAGVYAL